PHSVSSSVRRARVATPTWRRWRVRAWSHHGHGSDSAPQASTAESRSRPNPLLRRTRRYKRSLDDPAVLGFDSPQLHPLKIWRVAFAPLERASRTLIVWAGPPDRQRALRAATATRAEAGRRRPLRRVRTGRQTGRRPRWYRSRTRNTRRGPVPDFRC